MTKFNGTEAGIDKRQGASVTYYETWITPQIRVATWRGVKTETQDFATFCQILDRRGNSQRDYTFDIPRLADDVHPREALKVAVPAVIAMLEMRANEVRG